MCRVGCVAPVTRLTLTEPSLRSQFSLAHRLGMQPHLGLAPHRWYMSCVTLDKSPPTVLSLCSSEKWRPIPTSWAVVKVIGNVCLGAFPHLDSLQPWGPSSLWLLWGVESSETNGKLMTSVRCDPSMCAEQGKD